MHAQAVHLIPFEVAPQLSVGVLVQPVDIDLTVAVADVHEYRAVRKALDLCRSDDAVETATRALTVLTFEAESLARTASATGSQVTSEAGASGGQYVQLSGTPAAGAWIEFTLPNVAAGTYDVKMLFKTRSAIQSSRAWLASCAHGASITTSVLTTSPPCASRR